MNNVSFRVRLLSGKLQHFAVDANTPISDIKAKLDENLPPFHETRLCLGDVELCNGSVLEVSIQEGAQVQAVTIPLIEAAVEVFRQVCTQVITTLDPWKCSSYEEHVASINTSVLEFSLPSHGVLLRPTGGEIHLARQTTWRAIQLAGQFIRLGDPIRTTGVA